ncbi:MAG: tRNA (adenosine(37)-N6)-dimethylallyltransferase MiaA [Chitinophagales bacterium]|nr:tRNA (adenosine(37)-N6)-dimethylallyltransferase MiaA [Bacteroidota bacterium]MBP7400829.1 tRNA (adenosine(37)-N6)-dimethylallyltransferase MiaA [Chitinophagales bacterium]MBP9550058.1 tRNA (adenosine(37)-N6)-dimethylallyltransferase MiaA [Chitinophagales bacterium]MBP9703802.1 tRNA (adenosine(37)-N6)-dimethylallyltransferase MiaA [Chitinophagales bacterium]
MTNPENKFLIIIAGPTGIGKTNLAIQLAKEYNTEIISADARQFYKEMHIGTAKPDAELLATINHHFINNISIHDSYSVGQYEQEALQIIDRLFTVHNVVILVGGSGLYIDAIINGLDNLPASDAEIRKQVIALYETKGLEYLQEYISENDPEYFQIADIQNPQRLMRAMEVILQTGKAYSSFRRKNIAKRNFNSIQICLDMEREKLYQQINTRVDVMMQNCLLQEAEQLFSYRHLNALQTVGYKELFEFMEDKSTLETAINKIKQNTRNYAKRQLTWFRKDKSYTWFNPLAVVDVKNYIKEKMQ